MLDRLTSAISLKAAATVLSLSTIGLPNISQAKDPEGIGVIQNTTDLVINFLFLSSDPKEKLQTGSGKLLKITNSGLYYLDINNEEQFIKSDQLLSIDFQHNSLHAALKIEGTLEVALVDGSCLQVAAVDLNNTHCQLDFSKSACAVPTNNLLYIRFPDSKKYDQGWQKFLAKQDRRVDRVVLIKNGVLDTADLVVEGLKDNKITLQVGGTSKTVDWSGKIEGIIFQPKRASIRTSNFVTNQDCIVHSVLGDFVVKQLSFIEEGVLISTSAGLVLKIALADIHKINFLPNKSLALSAVAYTVKSWLALNASNDNTLLDSMLIGSQQPILIKNSDYANNSITIAEGATCEFSIPESFNRLVGVVTAATVEQNGQSVLTIKSGENILYKLRIFKNWDIEPEVNFVMQPILEYGLLVKKSTRPNQPTFASSDPIRIDMPLEGIRKITITVTGDIPLNLQDMYLLR